MMDTMDNYDNKMMTLDKLCLDNLHITNGISMIYWLPYYNCEHVTIIE